MRVLKAQVTNLIDIRDPTRFHAEIQGTGEIVTVYYTTPYNSMVFGEGGFTAYPREGDVILVTTTENDPIGVYYYLSTIIGQNLLPESGQANYPKGSKKFMTGNLTKETIAMSDHYGNGLEFISEGSDGGTKGVTRRRYTRLYSGGNQITMDNNPEVQGVIIRTKDDSVKIKMAGPKNIKAMDGPNSLLAYSRGNLKIKSQAGDISMNTHSEGGSINIFNMSRPDLLTGTPRDVIKGDLNLESLHNSVNIKAHAFLPAPAPPPKVFIEANKLRPDALVQVHSGGSMNLIAGSTLAPSVAPTTPGKMTIIADGDIDIISRTGSINLTAAQSIKLQDPTEQGKLTSVGYELNNKGV